MKKIILVSCFMAVLMLSLFIAKAEDKTDLGYDYSKGDDKSNIQYDIANPIVLADHTTLQYTPLCEGTCWLPINISYSGKDENVMKSIRKSDFDFTELLLEGNKRIRELEYYYLSLENYTDEEWYFYSCLNVTGNNTCLGKRYTESEGYFLRGLTEKIAKKEEPEIIVLKGIMNPTPFNQFYSIDIIPELWGWDMVELAEWNSTNYTYTRTGNTSKTSNTYWRGIEIQPFEDLRVVQLCGESNIGITNASVSNNNTTCYATSMANGCAEMNCNVTENHTYYAMIDSDYFYFYPPAYPYPIETDYFNITCDAQGADEQDPPYVCYNGGENWMNVRNITIQNLVEGGGGSDPTSTTLWLNGTSANLTGTYGQTINATGQSNVTGLYVECYHNGTLIANATTKCEDTDTWSGGTHNFTAFTIGNASFNSSLTTWWATLSTASDAISMSINESWAETYPTPVSITGSGNITASTLLRNGTSVANPYNILLGAGAYNFTFNTSGNVNYSANSTANTLVISKATPTLNLSFNTSASVPVDTQVWINCTSDPTGLPINMTYDLGYMGLPSVLTSATPTTYNITCNTSANQNYTTGEQNRTLTFYTSNLLNIPAVYDERTLNNLTFNLSIYNASFSETTTDITSYSNNTVSGNLTLAISADGYVERNYYLDIDPNGTTNITGYLLDSTEGVYIDFWAYSNSNPSGEPEAIVNMSRFLNSSWTLVEQQKADFEGKGIMFLDPYTEYRINASKGNLSYNEDAYSPNPDFILTMNLGGSGGGTNTTWLFSGVNYSLTPTNVYLGKDSNLTTFCYNISSDTNEIDYFALNLSYWNGTSLYFNNTTTAATGDSICTQLNSTLLNGTVVAQTWLKRDGYDVAAWERTYIVWYHGSWIPDVLEDVQGLGLSTVTVNLIAFFVCLGLSLGITKSMWRTGGGILFLIGMGAFVLYGWFNWQFYLGLVLIEIGLLMKDGLRGW